MSILDILKINIPRGVETIDIHGTYVTFSNDEIQFGEVINLIPMNFHFVTLASQSAEDIAIESIKLEGTYNVFIDYLMHRLITFEVKPRNIKELIYQISKSYVDVFKYYVDEAEVCCQGFEKLYLQEIRFHADNIISIKVEYVDNA